MVVNLRAENNNKKMFSRRSALEGPFRLLICHDANRDSDAAHFASSYDAAVCMKGVARTKARRTFSYEKPSPDNLIWFDLID